MTKLLPFNLEKALAGEKVCTRNGREVTQLFHFSEAIDDDERIYGVFDRGVHCWYVNGKYHLIDESHNDLFMLPKVTTYWANICKAENHNIYLSDIYRHEKEAIKDQDCHVKVIKTISFDIED